MAYSTIFARTVDGLPLVEGHGEAVMTPGGRGQAAAQQAQALLQRLHSMPAYCSVKCAGGYNAHIRIVDGICCMGLFCGNYPRNAAFAYLEEVRTSFHDELKREFGMCTLDYRSRIDAIEKPYYFLRFEHSIKRTYMQWRDPSSSSVLSKLQSDQAQVGHIMTCSFEELACRGDAYGSPINQAPQSADAPKSRSLARQWFDRLMDPAVLQKLAILILVFMAIGLVAFFAAEYDMWVPGFFCIGGVLFAHFLKDRLSGRRMEAKLSDKIKFAGEYYLGGLCGEHQHML